MQDLPTPGNQARGTAFCERNIMKQGTLIEIARGMLVTCLGAKAGEKVLVVTDDSRAAIGQGIYAAAQTLGCEAALMQMAPRKVAGEEPPAAVARAMEEADIVICPTQKSLTHTNARINAVKRGARVATMPGITEEMFFRGAITADYARVKELTEKLVEMLTRAETARIEKDGYVLTLQLGGRKGVVSSGVYCNPGESGNLPSGEAYIAPLETGSEGEMKIDGTMVGIGRLDSPLYLTVKNGRLTDIRGSQSGQLDVLLQTPENATLCELGIGTNDKAILCGVTLEDEKIYGTVHIAFGTNTSFGGVNKAGCHMDGIILRPTLYLDDVPVIIDGAFTFPT